MVAFIDQPPTLQNAPTNHLRIILLVEHKEMRGDSNRGAGSRQAFDLVEFSCDELICIDRVYPFDQNELLRLFF